MAGDRGDGNRDDAPVLNARRVVGSADRDQGFERVETQGEDANLLTAGAHYIGSARVGVAVAGNVLLEHAAT